jgi:hypothetical protein
MDECEHNIEDKIKAVKGRIPETAYTNCCPICQARRIEELEHRLHELEEENGEQEEFATEQYKALTNGVGEKPYYRKDEQNNTYNVYVADDQLFCTVPFEEGTEDEHAELITIAICESGLLIKKQARRIEELENAIEAIWPFLIDDLLMRRTNICKL